MAALFPLLTRAGYVVVYEAVTNCPSKSSAYQTITDAATCALAAAAHGNAYGSSYSKSNQPSGCIGKTGYYGTTYYFNTRSTSYKCSERSWNCVCKTVDPSPMPPPPSPPPQSPPLRIDSCGPRTFHNTESGLCEIAPDPAIPQCAAAGRRQASDAMGEDRGSVNIAAGLDEFLASDPELAAQMKEDPELRQIFLEAAEHVVTPEGA